MRARVYVRFDDGQITTLASLHGMVAVRYQNAAGMPAELSSHDDGLQIIDEDGRHLAWKRMLLSRVGQRTIAFLQIPEPRIDDWPLVRVHRLCRQQGFALLRSDELEDQPAPVFELVEELVAS
ncbi:MAG: hypothetical protein AAGD38_10635 [Acidobacteriota bacterium]